MSIFKRTPLNCPHCRQTMDFDACASINAARRPDLRQAVLDGSLQRQDCPACGRSVRLDPQLTYVDVGRQQWIAAFPRLELDRWAELEGLARQSFERGFGEQAGAEVAQIGAPMRPRVVFGWSALREKLLLADAGLDDATVELTKMALLRGVDDPPLLPGQELRVDAVDEQTLGYLLVPDLRARGQGEQDGDRLQMPRAVYDDVLAAADDWAALRAAVSAGLFVDVLRLTRGAAAG